MIQVFKPSIGQAEIDAVAEVLRSGWIGLGPKTAEFERRFAQYIGTNYAIGVNSCTSALDLALKLLGITEGDEILVPTVTFVSTAHAVAYNLATPIFCDIDEGTLQIDVKEIKKKTTSRTKAVIPVHYSGRPCDMDSIKEAAKGLAIIEDAAHACGAEYKAKKCGTLGDIGCFSFHAVKNLAMGDGGALTLDDKILAERAKRLRWVGIDRGTWDRTKLDRSYWWKYHVDEIGLKCHMNDIAASIGLVQLNKLESMNKRRREIASMYTKAFQNIKQIETPVNDDKYFKSSWHIYCIKCKKRDDLSIFLQSKGINTGVHYTPIHTYSCYGNSPSLPVAEEVSKKIMSLPIYPDLTNQEVQYVIKTIKEFFAR